jgi:hypothetical protein
MERFGSSRFLFFLIGRKYENEKCKKRQQKMKKNAKKQK